MLQLGREQGSDIDAAWTIKSEGTTSRNEVKTYVKRTIFH